jgi:hypothetical protein
MSRVLLSNTCDPATQKAEIRRIAVQSQPGKIVRPYLKKNLHKKGLEEWLRG